MNKFLTALLMATLLMLNGCAASASKALLDSSESQLKLRQMQSRVFDTNDKRKTMENVMATLQDLGFVIDKASFELGSISATKLSGYNLRMTASVANKGEDRVSVRVNAQYGIKPVTQPEPYQQFFASLEKSMFLEAHLDE